MRTAADRAMVDKGIVLERVPAEAAPGPMSPEPMSQEAIDLRLAEIGYKLEHHNAHLIRLAHQRATALFQKAFEGMAITPTQMAILATLLRHGGMSQIHLGRLTAIDTATLSPMLSRLQGFDFIERIPSEEDQRVNLVRLTDKGVAFTLEALPVAKQVSEDVLAPLKPRDRDRFVRMLTMLG